MKHAFASLPIMALAAGCHVSLDTDDNAPVKTETRAVERGSAEYVKAVIHMGAGELKVKGGAAKLLDAEFRSAHPPTVTYDAKGSRGALEIRSPDKATWGHKGENKWTLNFDSQTPIDMEVHLGAGETDLDLSALALRSLQVHMGVGELRLNLNGDYHRDVEVEVNGGVGRAEIRLPRKMGAQVDAKGGLGSMKTRGLKKESSSGFYVNGAYETSTRQVRCKVRGGIGEIDLIGDSE
jgi:N-terminal domain of toast_rack, DUF2154